MGRALGNIIGTAAPIAAGYFGGPAMAGLTGGATSGAIAAGALTGAGIAALSGQDMLGGAITGGLGGMGGGAFRGAADATKLAASGVGGGTTAGVNAVTQAPMTNTLASSAGTFNPALTQSTGLPQLTGGTEAFAAEGFAPNMGQVNPMPPNVVPNMAQVNPGAGLGTGGYNPSGLGRGLESAQAALNEPGKFLENLGDGDKVIGAGKAALTASQPIMAGLQPEFESFDEQRKDKYDPNSQLDLSMDTGIGSALDRDTGLRLLAEGGEVGDSGPIVGVAQGIASDIPMTSYGAIIGAADIPPADDGSYMMYKRRQELGMAEGGQVKKFVIGGQTSGSNEPEYNTQELSTLSEYGVVPQYTQSGSGIYASAPVRKPVTGTVDVGGKFVADPKGDMTDVEFVDKFDYILDSDKNKKKQGSGGPMMSGNQSGIGSLGPGASQALAGLAKGVARSQQSQAGNQINRLGGLARGGYLETGGAIGDGMSDDIKATINNSQPARLSDGEFVIPADVVSHLGNGSSDAGAERLYSMMDKVRQARTGNKKQGKEIKPERYMPA